MKATEATELASNFARQKGYDIIQYNIKTAKRGGQWRIFFHRKSGMHRPRPGDFFTVYVDDRSESIRRIVYGK
mgnify:CR=1 FL=1